MVVRTGWPEWSAAPSAHRAALEAWLEPRAAADSQTSPGSGGGVPGFLLGPLRVAAGLILGCQPVPRLSRTFPE